jgi:hypothetical protein
LYVLPGKGDLPIKRIWKIIPILKTSQIGSILDFISLIFTTSGATYPGVPHLTNRYYFLLHYSESPKSAITQS